MTSILDDDQMFSLVGSKFLEEQWSPEQIEGRLALVLGASPVSDSTIYRAIAAGRFAGLIGGRRASRRLRRKGKARRVSVNIFFTISTNIFSPIAPPLFRRPRQRGCAASG